MGLLVLESKGLPLHRGSCHVQQVAKAHDFSESERRLSGVSGRTPRHGLPAPEPIV
jgi:hypothetical protein